MFPWVLVLLAVWLGGCSALLPVTRQETVMPWHSFDDAKAAYNRITPYQTTQSELHQLGFDPALTPNVNILNASQVVRAVMPQPVVSIAEFPPGIQDCYRAESECVGYSLEQSVTRRKRVGNFFLDFLNFDRETEITGWRFNTLLAIVRGTVVFKQWSGQPNVAQFERNRNPLGPIQDSGGRLLNR